MTLQRIRHITHTPTVAAGRRLLLRCAFITALLILPFSAVWSQVTIGGNVYGGGNHGEVEGSTAVVVRGGDLQGKVFGGARQANVGKYAFVNIDGENQHQDITINHVYGGNDIAGHIGDRLDGTEVMPIAHPEVNDKVTDANKVDNTWQSYILTTPEANGNHIYIGQMFGGGNGDYDYTTETLDDETANPYYGLDAPIVARSYMQVNGGTFGYVYAGGNAATVTEKAVISINNESEVTTATDALDLTAATENLTNINIVFDDNPTDLRLMAMGINISTFSNERQFINIFGGNNKADMSIRPIWNLMKGSVHNLYSGGNEGRMTNLQGILLEIPEDSEIQADNVYGGCRKADVRPLRADGRTDATTNEIHLDGYHFPNGLSARVLVRGGNITNVYGGNDISGDVYGGNAVGVYTSIHGDIYGGGNGSYAYTDNPTLKNDIIWGDFYYDPAMNDAKSSVDALDLYRPHAEQVSIRIYGQDAEKPTIIEGSVYIGGNSASLRSTKPNPMAHLKIGSNVIADNVFLGNNGVNMVDASQGGVLEKYAGNVVNDHKDNVKFSSLDLTNPDIFEKYMGGCAMELIPSIVFDSRENGDPDDYVDYTAHFGSFFCGGNVGSIKTDGTTTINFNHHITIYDKLVGGCNNANVEAHEGLNARFLGGILNVSDPLAGDEIANKLVFNLEGLHIEPMRWIKDDEGRYVVDANGNRQLEWNTFDARTSEPTTPPATLPTDGLTDDNDLNRRIIGGNIYGGCYMSGHVDGNVVININGTILDREAVFDQVEKDENGEAVIYDDKNYKITRRNSGVIIDEQSFDVLATALNIFGGGYGEDSEIWGSTTIHLNKGYVFQVFGGGELGVIGKRNDDGEYEYDDRYSTYINLNGAVTGVARDATGDSDEMAETEYIYGGGFEGLIAGNTHINLGNGRIYDAFGGSCNADILGHTEIYIGRSSNDDSDLGFPWIRDHIYGANDLGGEIRGEGDFSNRVSSDNLPLVYNPESKATPDVLKASAYIEYIQGRVDNIFGGCYGDYDYRDRVFEKYTDANGLSKEGFTKPRIDNAFVHFRPTTLETNQVSKIFGAGEGHPREIGKDSMQMRSYVLIDAPQSRPFLTTEVFGAGAYGGLGMGLPASEASAQPDKVSAVIDLLHGQIQAAYGASYMQGFTRRTVVNVPEGSTVVLDNIFGGGYGVESNAVPCDAYEAQVNYRSDDARVNGAIYGGNNNYRRTLYSQVNIAATVSQSNGYNGYVYGAGLGKNTWAQYTEVNILDGGYVWEAYGGGNAGRVLNESSVKAMAAAQSLDISLGDGYSDPYLDSPLARSNALFADMQQGQEKYNANVHIMEGGTVANYCYGGGYGADAVVSGTTYIDLQGGTVRKDLYGGGTSGAVKDLFRQGDFTASANVYIKGGSVRNVYGGGWKGDVGYHDDSTTSTANDVLGDTHVYIGMLHGDSYVNGIPVVQRNAYGGGEGGPIYGTANLTLYNGYIGYVYNAEATDDPETPADERYEEKLLDETADDGIGQIVESGNIFGAGYVDYSNADITNVTLYGGTVRNGLYGGGEIGSVGRGSKAGNDITIDKAGETHIYMYGGHVRHDVFGGGRGYDNLNRVGDLGIPGYIFGKTDVNIFGGEVGTAEGVANGYGNVFGGGNVGYVYSGTGRKSGSDNDGGDNGYYYEYRDGAFTTVIDEEDEEEEKILTEDCRVVVTPYCLVTADGGVTLSLYDHDGATIDGSEHHFDKGDYVPIAYLNSIKNKSAAEATWSLMDCETGITIHNAVFAGGNVSVGSDQLYANATTVFGNATATLCDVFHRDLITIGTEHTGGLYGDGNLTFVDGYRELNITNYGTDYYNMSDNISIEEYHALTDRERAYFELKYKCIQECTDNKGTEYSVNSSVTEEDFKTLFAGTTYILDDGTPDPAYWIEAGFCSIYAGRLLNTIQRADFVGVFGSRMVLQGARDRVPEKIDYTDYTINRVGEVSLNQQRSTAGDDAERDPQNYLHGNYFGIYNVVHFMGALTSDVNFYDETRTTDNANTEEYGPEIQKDADGNLIYRDAEKKDPVYVGDDFTYYTWKSKYHDKRKRNNGTSMNKVALASGVFLELTNETASASEKSWGIVTGVVQLDLINVMPGLGGGYVYAKNVHGHRVLTGLGHTIISDYNRGAVTNQAYRYEEADGSQETVETSGNFVHPTKQIVDDCYPVSNSYRGAGAAAAHYWYIKGQVYVYDQIISAYTGATNAYSETVNIPLTITAASHGRMKLLNIQPNKYAYYSLDGHKLSMDKDDKMIINNVSYALNDTINYWDWSQLSVADQERFVDETYIVITNCRALNEDGQLTDYPKGYVMLPAEYEALKSRNTSGKVYHTEKQEDVDFTYAFRSSNNLGHDTGFILTYEVNNPMLWSGYYTPLSGTADDKLNTRDYNDLAEAEKRNYTKGPTYTPKAGRSGVYGQRDYAVGNIITKDIVDTYNAIDNSKRPAAGTQAQIDVAYVMTDVVVLHNADGTESTYNAGVPIAKATYDNTPAMSGKAAKAWTCISTIEVEKDGQESELIFFGDLVTEARLNELRNDYGVTDAEIAMHFDEAYYCTQAGKYGGNYYEEGRNYRALNAWSSLSADDRENFSYNYDALDILIDSEYRGNPAYYDSESGHDRLVYSREVMIDYKATYNGTTTLEYTDEHGTTVSIAPDETIEREAFEEIPNEQSHYSPILVDSPGDYYIVKVGFSRGDVPYTVGQTIAVDAYNNLGDDLKQNIDVVTFNGALGTYYYCRGNYMVNENGEGTPVTNVRDGATVALGQNVPLGFVINEENYERLPNKQRGFSIQGSAPAGTSTIYVSNQSDIFDMSRGKVITLIYQYDYEESDESGKHIEQISERHVVNIYLQFKSGIPTISTLSEPSLILPGSTIGLTPPHVTPGASEIVGGGWEIFATEDDAQSHLNGTPYENNFTKMYFYQDGYWVAYYAKTYLGKTYSNAVQFRVGNYHDIDNVMADHEHHMYVDHPNVKRDCKIYIDDRDCASAPEKSKLDLLRDFFDLTLHNDMDDDGNAMPISGGTLDGHHTANSHIREGEHLEFFLRSDVSPKAYTAWTPIADADGTCFQGVLHGDGHTIAGLDHALFGHLCGDVYNLGVTGSFSTAGLAREGSGYAENCWVMTSCADDLNTYPIIGNPTRTGGTQIVNCYYPDTDRYLQTDCARGNATRRSARAFYNGEVAYDLNGFYLKERYDRHRPDGQTAIADDYVESRYADGDFIYAGGSIPETADERMWTDDEEHVHYTPVWPDDYLFFGQQLNYDHVAGRSHQAVPSYVNKNGGRLSTIGSNRVYRAPAYFQSKQMQKAYFNRDAIMAARSQDGTGEAYPGLTALDFTGYGDGDYQPGLVADGAYSQTAGGAFYPPLLDDDGLNSFQNVDLTRNLLVYIPEPTANTTDAASRTYNVISGYLNDPAYSEANSSSYRNVTTTNTTALRGHRVVLHGTDYLSPTDHFLVDKQDYNAPIAYTFARGKHIWYQRVPDVYVDLSTGWEGLSLPFTPELVTTQSKGELTHFYEGSTTGHEYWLREFGGNVTSPDADGMATADFNLPAASSWHKDYTNTFLWDYYYARNDYRDENADRYQSNYYATTHTYGNYPLAQAGRPYIVGMPGKRYYEFDLSGTFEPEHTYTTVARLPRQIITFVSEPGITVAVSDDELADETVTAGSFAFVPNYTSRQVPAGSYMLDATGSRFDRQSEAVTSVPFRPYIAATAAARSTRGITFNTLSAQFGIDDREQQDTAGRLDIRSAKGRIILESTLRQPVTVGIFRTTGIAVGTFTIEPGQTVETAVVPGIYIVNRTKITVK